MDNPGEKMHDLIRRDGRYPREAFAFLHEGLNRAVQQIHGNEKLAESQNEEGLSEKLHVTGQQLCESLRDYAIDRWGLLAPTVLRSWGICESLDFGNMVYLLIEGGFMRKTDDDSIEDFRDVYDFEKAFDVPLHFEIQE